MHHFFFSQVVLLVVIKKQPKEEKGYGFLPSLSSLQSLVHMVYRAALLILMDGDLLGEFLRSRSDNE